MVLVIKADVDARVGAIKSVLRLLRLLLSTTKKSFKKDLLSLLVVLLYFNVGAPTEAEMKEKERQS
jgi:uncharacterized membrane protein YoaK (UPF0700 family)